MSYNLRIDENFLRGDHVDGEVLQHTDLNEIENVAKTAINANYEDIQKLQDGTISIGNSEKLDGATLSKFATETLQNSDTKVPTSSQVKQYVDGALSNINLEGYYTKRETDELLEENYYSKDETIPCFVGTSQTPVEITDILDYVNTNSFYVRGYKTICGNYYPDGELFFLIPDTGGYYNIYDVTEGKIYKINGSTTTVVGVSDTILNLLSGNSSNPINLDTIGEGVYIIDGNSPYILGGSTHYGFSGNYAIVGVQPWNNDTRRYVFSDGTVTEITRTESGGDYVYSWNGDYQFVTDNDLHYINDLEYYYNTETLDDILINYFVQKSELDDYVKNTDYATASKGGVIKSGYYGLQVDGTNGKAYCDTYTYANYGNVENQRFISKGTLENVITGKGLVSNTDYASSDTGGVIKYSGNYATYVNPNNGILSAETKTYAQYGSGANSMFISKGTLENVLTATIGDIQTLLDNLDTGSGV